MKTKHFFFASALILSALSSFALTSCQNDDDDDDNVTEQTTNRTNEVTNVFNHTITISEDAAQLFDVKATYVIDGKTIVEYITEDNLVKTDSVSFEDYDETISYKYLQLASVKKCDKTPSKATISIVPKKNAAEILKSQPEDKKYNFVVRAKCFGSFSSMTHSDRSIGIGLYQTDKEYMETKVENDEQIVYIFESK